MERTLIASYSKKDFRIDTFCAGGPGGQNQNKKQSGVRIVHLPSGLVAESREHRHQAQNMKAAFTRLARLIKAWHQGQLVQARHTSNETVRTYHEQDNRVTDHASGLKQSYTEVEKRGLDAMIASRINALL